MRAADGFIYFAKGEFPCIFLMEVHEGVARFEVKDPDTLDRLLSYCKDKSYGVSWARAVADDPKNRRLYEGFPGGKYVASSRGPDEASDQ